jgi:hypothetical protein
MILAASLGLPAATAISSNAALKSTLVDVGSGQMSVTLKKRS